MMLLLQHLISDQFHNTASLHLQQFDIDRCAQITVHRDHESVGLIRQREGRHLERRLWCLLEEITQWSLIKKNGINLTC